MIIRRRLHLKNKVLCCIYRNKYQILAIENYYEKIKPTRIILILSLLL